MITNFLKQLLALSLSGTFLFWIILLLKQFYKNRFCKCWQYYILCVAALRFLIPFAPNHTLVGCLTRTAELEITKLYGGQQPDCLSAAVADAQANADRTASLPLPSDQHQTHAGNQPTDQHLAESAGSLSIAIFLLWLITALILIIRKITSYQQFVHDIKTNSIEISDVKTWNLLTGCAKRLKLKKPAALYVKPQLSSPVMTGFMHPCIALPDENLPKTALSFIFLHELTHYKRRDMFYKWLVQFIVCIHWFNPFIYLLEQETNRACELACDEAVIRSLDTSARRAYGDTLLLCSRPGNRPNHSAPSIPLTKGAAQLKERLGAIMNFKKNTKKTTALTAVFTVCICICSAVIGTYAAPVQPANQTPETVQNQAAAAKTASKKANNIPSDVKKVLTLKTPGYQNFKLETFSEYISSRYEANLSLWKARQRLPWINLEKLKNRLSEEDYLFLTITLPCTEAESTYPYDRTGSIPPDFGSQFQIHSKKHRTTGTFEWTVRYQVKSPDITIKQRDERIWNVKNGMAEFVKNTPDDTDPTTLEYLKKMRHCLNRLVKETTCSDLEMTVFQCMGDGVRT